MKMVEIYKPIGLKNDAPRTQGALSFDSTARSLTSGSLYLQWLTASTSSRRRIIGAANKPTLIGRINRGAERIRPIEAREGQETQKNIKGNCRLVGQSTQSILSLLQNHI
jgi:hypothetical protein